MRTLLQRIDRSSQKEIVLVGMIVCLLTYVAYCTLVGLHGSIESSLFQLPDSWGYRAVAEWIFHGGQAPAAAAKRPFLYPLVLGISLMFGPLGVWLMNVCFWFASIFLVARAVWKMTQSNRATLAVFCIFSLNLSLMDLTLRALSEIPVLFVLSLWVWKLARVDFEKPRIRDVVILLLLMVAATLIKPQYQLHLIFLLVVLILIGPVRVLFRKNRSRFFLSGLLVITPLVPQFLIVHSVTGRYALSTAGGEELKRYIIPELVLRLNAPLSWGDRRQLIERTRAEISDWDAQDCIRLIASHPLLFSKTLIENIFRDNLMEGSLTFGSKPRLFTLSKLHNTCITVLHIYFIPLILLIVLAPGIRAPGVKLLLLAGSSVVIFLSSGLVFWAGDRVIIIAEVFWLPAYLTTMTLIRRDSGIRAAFCRSEH